MFEQLTYAESKVAKALLEGRSNAGIAEALGLSISTVKFHLTQVYKKTGTMNDRDLFAKVIKGVELENHGLFTKPANQTYGFRHNSPYKSFTRESDDEEGGGVTVETINSRHS